MFLIALGAYELASWERANRRKRVRELDDRSTQEGDKRDDDTQDRNM